MPLKRKLLSAAALLFTCVGLLLLGIFCQKQTRGLDLGLIVTNPPYEKDFASELGQEQKQEIQTILNQSFFYQKRDYQNFSFVSEDNQYVLKILKYRKNSLFGLFKVHIRSLFSSKMWEQLQIRLKSDCYHYLSYRNLPQQTGLLYLHLNATTELNQTVTLVDALKIAHSLPADQILFVLQKKTNHPPEEAFSGAPLQNALLLTKDYWDEKYFCISKSGNSELHLHSLNDNLQVIKYLDAQEREKFKITINSQGICSQNGQVMKKGFYRFIFSLEQELFAISTHPPGESFGEIEPRIPVFFKHTSLSRGEPVLAAGEMEIGSDGKILSLNNKSGHYKPSMQQMRPIAQYLQKLHLNYDIPIFRFKGKNKVVGQTSVATLAN